MSHLRAMGGGRASRQSLPSMGTSLRTSLRPPSPQARPAFPFPFHRTSPFGD